MEKPVLGKQGSLVIVGTGINTLAHCSIEARAHIEQAEKLIVHVPDPLGMSWLRELHPDLIDLQPTYKQGSNRADAYELMVRNIIEQVEAGHRTVAVFYGHPGVFVYPSHEAIRRLRKRGYQAQMLPGISAEDCLFADLGLDPAQSGCVQHEASSFLFYIQPVDTSTGLILWQIGVVGDHTLKEVKPHALGLAGLRDKLLRYYPKNHSVVIYQAPVMSFEQPRTTWVSLCELANTDVTPSSTLFVPPCKKAEPDLLAINSMGLTLEQVISPVCSIQ